ncbi:virulence-associated protein E [Elizabethkingia phage TCUEAP1]|nr:virulence-associated protein E [Elizabethkingia phage TCUEAP1]
MEQYTELDIATGLGAKSKQWRNSKITWAELVEKLRDVKVTLETHREYMSATKAEQAKIKDIGGFVGGYLAGGRRKAGSVLHRSVVTLDIDFALADFWETFKEVYSCDAVLHSTHKHSPISPRYRLVIPLDRPVTPDEYSAISRKIAGNLGIELFDSTTFQSERLMFWPSISKDAVYVFEEQSGGPIDADAVLAEYVDWRDVSAWPTSDATISHIMDGAKKQEDPLEKRGLIGVFCRTYTIPEVIDAYLSEDYIEGTDGRYTYKNGSAASGLVIYEHKFAYSWHGTDPASNKLCNAYDLVRLHKFAHLDSETNTTKSVQAMEALILKDLLCKATIAQERLESAGTYFYDDAEETFGNTFEETPEETSFDLGFDMFDIGIDFISADPETVEVVETEPEEVDINWMLDLETDAKSNYLNSALNFSLVMRNDAKLKGVFKYNSFDNNIYVMKSTPWRQIDKPERIRNVDYSGIRNYVETLYKISANQKLDDAMLLEVERHKYHPIKDFLQGLKWDGVKRIDTILHEYYGTPNNVYYSEALRKMLVGAVARIMRPGCKFDLVLTLVGKQGQFKSTFIKRLGKDWFSDTFYTVTGKDAYEQIQGAWLIEMAELAGIKKAEVESTKHFITKQEDTFRPAFMKTIETFKRQCVFFGTTNNMEFLKDATGNRRFMPVQVHLDKATKDIKNIPEQLIDDLWAEAYHLYNEGETLYLSEEAEALANEVREIHSEKDERLGMLERYLDMRLPIEWTKMTIEERRFYIDNYNPDDVKDTHELRQRVSSTEVWVECFKKDPKDVNMLATRDFTNMMAMLKNWEKTSAQWRDGLYGKNRGFIRIN